MGTAEYWSGADFKEVAGTIARDVLGFGSVLPLCRFDQGSAVPVVEWKIAALRYRLESGQGPVVKMKGLSSMYKDGMFPVTFPPVLEPVTFIVVDQFPQARQIATDLALIARSIVAIPGNHDLDSLEAMECDFRGVTVMRVSSSQTETVVCGYPGIMPGSSYHPAWRRLNTEVIFKCALDQQQLPDLTPY